MCVLEKLRTKGESSQHYIKPKIFAMILSQGVEFNKVNIFRVSHIFQLFSEPTRE